MPKRVHAALLDVGGTFGKVRLAVDNEMWIARPPYEACDRLKVGRVRDGEAPNGIASIRAYHDTVYAWCLGLHDIQLAAHWIDLVAEVAMAAGKREDEVKIAEILSHWMDHLSAGGVVTGREAMTPAAARRVAGLTDATWRNSLGFLASLHPDLEEHWLRMLRYPRATIADDASTVIWTLNRLPAGGEWLHKGHKAAICLLRALDPSREQTEFGLVQSLKAWLAKGCSKAA